MKYMGSKSRIAKHIVPIIQSYIDENSINTYIEPFVGGANVIDKIKCKTRKGYDLNKYLIELLRYVQAGGVLLEEVSKELYDVVRTVYNNGDTTTYRGREWIIGNVGFVASYNGRFFDGGYAKPGYEKTKNGLRYRDYYREAKDNLMAQAPLLKDIVFEASDYKNIKLGEERCVIYCDPPYANTKQFKNSQAFDYDEFWNKMREWSKEHIVLISELTAPDDFECIWSKDVSRSIKATDKGKACEKLFKYRGEII